MADKVVAIKIDVQGTADQKRKLEGLEKTLQGLTEQQRKLKKQLKDGAITRDQYAKSIAKVNLGLKGTRRQLLVTRQAMLNIDGFTTRLGKSFARLGTSISGAFVGLFAVQKLFQVFQEGLEVNKQFEKSISELSAITGQSGKELDKLSDAARRMGKETTKSAVEVAQAFTVVGSKRPELLKNADALIEVTEASILLSEAAGIAVPDAAQAVTLALNQFGSAAGGASKVVDVLAAASVEGSVLIPQLAEELAKFGGIAEKSGLSVAQAAASVEVVGKTVEQSGTKLRNILIKLESGSERFRPSVVGLNTALDNLAKEGFTEIAPLAEKFGRQNAEAALAVIQNRSEVAKLTDALDVNGIAQRQATVMTDNLDGAQKRLGSAFDELFLTIGDGSEGGALTKLIDSIAEGVNSFSEWANETGIFSEVFKLFTQGVKFSLKPIILLFQGVQSLIGSFDTADSKVSVVVKTLRVFGATIDTVKLGIETLVNTVVTGFGGIGRIIKAALSGSFSEIPDIIKETFKESANGAIKFKDETVKAFKNAVDEKAILDEKQTAKEKQELEKRLKEAKRVEAEKKKATEESIKQLSKEQKAQAKRDAQEAKRLKSKEDSRLKAEQNFIDKVNKLQKTSSLLAIDDERKLQLEKLKIKKEALEAEAKIKVQQGSKLDNTLLTLTSSFKLKEDAINKTFDDKQKALDAENLLKEKEDKVRKFENIANVGNFAINSTKSLIDSIANIELSAEERKLERGIINEEEFAQAKYEIEKKAFNTQKKADIAQAIINGALAVSKAFAQGGLLGFATAGLVTAQTGAQVASISKQNFPQSFAEGGYTGDGVGTPDATGFRQAGVVHEGEYVVPKNVLESNGGSRLVGALESMRTNRPQPYLGSGFANGGFSSGGSGLDLTDMENRITKAVVGSIGSIPVVNVATDTTIQANRVNNIQSEATFG